MLGLRVLGPLVVLRDGAVIDIPGVRVHVLLSMLALNHERAVAVDELVEVLWPGEPPGPPRAPFAATSPDCVVCSVTTSS